MCGRRGLLWTRYGMERPSEKNAFLEEIGVNNICVSSWGKGGTLSQTWKYCSWPEGEVNFGV
eukprot:UN08047